MAITKEMNDILNDQLNLEIESAHIYLAMGGYAATLGLEGFVHFFEIQYDEELFHAKKIMKFIIDRNGIVDIRSFKNPQNKFDSLLQAVEISLENEKAVSARFDMIAGKAAELGDYATRQFSDWYISEQVEEEALFQSIIDKINLVQDGAGLYLLDKEMAERILEVE